MPLSRKPGSGRDDDSFELTAFLMNKLFVAYLLAAGKSNARNDKELLSTDGDPVVLRFFEGYNREPALAHDRRLSEELVLLHI